MLSGMIDGATNRLLPPADFPSFPLYVRLDDSNDIPRVTSAWYPSPDEIALLVAGAPIHLHIYDYVHPAVALTVPDA